MPSDGDIERRMADALRLGILQAEPPPVPSLPPELPQLNTPRESETQQFRILTGNTSQ